MKKNQIGVCPACSVKIIAGDKVLFSSGSPGTRARLWTRVCQYNKKPGCINPDQEAIGEIQPNDYYSPPEELTSTQPVPEPVTKVVTTLLEQTDQ